MRLLIVGMLSTLVCGCGQTAQTQGGAPERALDDTGQVSSPLRIGRRPPAVAGPIRKSLLRAADRLSDLQADRIGDNAHNGLDDDDPDDGGWDFTITSDATSHSTAASPSNTYGATGLGIWAAVRAGDDAPRLRTTLLGTGLGAEERPEVDSPNDFVFLPLLAELAEDAGFSDLARARYDAKVAAAGGARTLAEQDRSARHAAGYDGIILYDLAWYMLGAAALDAAFPGSGYDADADAYASVAVDTISASPPIFDVEDASEQFYVQGLAWSLVVLDRGDPAPALASRIRGLLADLQGSDGAWGFNASTPADDLQSTAHAVAALSLTSHNEPHGRREAMRGARYLQSHQAANGGWEYATGQENTLVDADAMLALYLSQSFPAPGALEPGAASEIGQAAQSLSNAAASPAAPPLAAPAD